MAAVLNQAHARTVAASSPGSGAGISRGALARTLVRLKWKLWKRSFHKNLGKTVGTVVTVIYAVSFLPMIGGLTLMALLAGEIDFFAPLIRALGALATLMWLLIPVLAVSMDDTLDARLFALFPRRAKELQPGMFLGGLIEVGAVFTLLGVVLVTAAELLWLRMGGAAGTGWLIAGIISILPFNLIGFITCLLLPRAWFAHSASRQSSRRGREIGAVLTLFFGFAIVYGGGIAMSRGGGAIRFDTELLESAGQIIAWTPFGAAFSVPLDLATGAWLPALLRALVAAATVPVLWLWWRHSLDKSLTSALLGDAESVGSKGGTLVPFGLPATPLTAVMGRSLRYYRRDSRYLTGLGILPLLLALLAAAGMTQPSFAMTALGISAFIIASASMTLFNELGYDGPAGWVNITAGLDAAANIRGRQLAQAVFYLPLAIVAGIALPLLLGAPQLIVLYPVALVSLLMTGWGLSAVLTVFLAFPTSPPGVNPLKDKSGSSGAAFISSLAGFGGIALLQSPAITLAVIAVATSSVLLQVISGVLFVVVGVLVLVLGQTIAIKRLLSHYPDIFTRVRNFA